MIDKEQAQAVVNFLFGYYLSSMEFVLWMIVKNDFNVKVKNTLSCDQQIFPERYSLQLGKMPT